MSSSLEERLKNNSSAFDGLLSLIPAKYYYDDDTQDQWKAKKKSKDELKQNKRAKLDPEQSKESERAGTAADVLKKRAQTAKPVVIPGQQKINHVVEGTADVDDKREQSESEDSEDVDEEEKEDEASKPSPKTNGITRQNSNGKKASNSPEDESEEEINVIFDDEGNEIDMTTQKTIITPVKENGTKTVDDASSSGSSKAQNFEGDEKKKKEESLKVLKDKLQSKINTMREKRKAPGTKAVGAPSSREAILEERRKRAELKAEKKRKLAEIQDEEEDASDASDDDASDVEETYGPKSSGVIFQNIVFDEKTKATSDLQNIRVNKKKGPAKKDIKAHLKLIEQKKQKLNGLDDDKKKELAEKDKWNKTFAQAEGQKIKDDERLLKKALKKKEAQKRKSEIQWQERKDNVQNMISAKAKRREENLEIRKMNKGVKRKSQVKQLRKFKTKISPKRAGFEGRNRSRGKK